MLCIINTDFGREQMKLVVRQRLDDIVVYKTADAQEFAAHEIRAMHVTREALNNLDVLYVVQRDAPRLKPLFPDANSVRLPTPRTYSRTLITHHSTSSQIFHEMDVMIKQKRKQVVANIHEIRRQDFCEKYKRTSGQKKEIVRAFDSGLPGIVVTKFYYKSFMDKYVLKMDDDTIYCMNKLLAKVNLGPLTPLQIKYGTHYGYIVDGELVTLLSTLNAQLGNTFKLAVSIDWVVDISEQHMAYTLVEKLKCVIRKRKQTSYIFTQCARKPKAIRFWQGRFNNSKMSNLLVGAFHLYDHDYLIYEDVHNMMA